MAFYRVMGRGETGEESCFADDLTAAQAEDWIPSNENQYPETVFWVEQMESHCCHGDEEEGEYIP